MNVLYSASYGGNLHYTSDRISEEGLADYVLAMEYHGGSTVVVFRMPAEKVAEIIAPIPSFTDEYRAKVQRWAKR